MSNRPPATHRSSEAMLFVLMSCIAFCNVGSAVPVGVAHLSGWEAGIVIRASVCCWVNSSACYYPASWRRVCVVVPKLK